MYPVVCENSIMALRGLAFVELEETTEAFTTRDRAGVDHRRPGHDEFVAETLVRPFFMIMLHKRSDSYPEVRLRRNTYSSTTVNTNTKTPTYAEEPLRVWTRTGSRDDTKTMHSQMTMIVFDFFFERPRTASSSASGNA